MEWGTIAATLMPGYVVADEAPKGKPVLGPSSSMLDEMSVDTAKKMIVLREPTQISPKRSMVAAPKRTCREPAKRRMNGKMICPRELVSHSSGCGEMIKRPPRPHTRATR